MIFLLITIQVIVQKRQKQYMFFVNFSVYPPYYYYTFHNSQIAITGSLHRSAGRFPGLRTYRYFIGCLYFFIFC